MGRDKHADFLRNRRQLQKQYGDPFGLHKNKRKSSNGCYVATAVYGSYDCPEVWTLRRYRDFQLRPSWLGRVFIKTYYCISPTLVALFGKQKWFVNNCKKILDKMVQKLNSEGVQNTPYHDE